MGKSDFKYYCHTCRIHVHKSGGPVHSSKGHQMEFLSCEEINPITHARCLDPKGHPGDHHGDDGFEWPDFSDLEIKDDPVNHPKNYTSDPSGIECIQITRHRNFNVGNAIKYLWRAGLKDSDISGKGVEDLEKAVWYIKDEIKRIESTGSR